ncbi:MAG: hypothetical protein ABFD64_05740 [Armatimonadota bacterium]
MMKSMNKSKVQLGNERGQSLVIAIIVMLLLAFISVVFVVLVARNQGRAGRSRDVITAQYLSEAGIHYADNMLMTSDDGADWRPVPDNMPKTSTAGVDNTLNPDFQWLRPYSAAEATDGSTGPTGGYTTFRMGDGRYLLRVSYNPDPKDPMSKYIKIESIGRIGTVENDDPTTWDSNVRLRRELTAYKPIGVTDYLRFVTNLEKKSEDIPLGAAGFNVKYGNETTAGEGVRGAPIRVNGNLEWYGNRIDLVLRGTSYQDGSNTDYMPLDMVEVSGTIKHENVDVNNSSQPVPVTLYEVINGGTVNSYPVQPSDYTQPFTTAYGFYRDGSDSPDAGKNARGIKRLEPPLLDDEDTPTKVSRYIALTRDSGIWLQQGWGTQRWVNSGRYGWGRGIYIDNSDDIQQESETLFGGYTPRADWMKPNNDMSAYWQGPYYVPPGVVITLNPYDTDGDNQPDITITRTDIKSKRSDALYGKKSVWYNSFGVPMNDKGSTITIPYPQGTQTFTHYNVDDSGNKTAQDITIDRNGVIYAEGNIRIKGMLAQGKQLTVVSGGIIYVEGNLLKYRDTDGNVDPTSAVSLLAKQYVCVNTTQFVSLLSSLGPTSIGSDSGTGQPPYHLIVTPEPSTTFFSSFSFGPPTGSWQMGNDTMLFVRHAGQYGPSYINMWLNRGSGTQGLLHIGQNSQYLPPDWVYGCGDPRYCLEGTGLSSLFEHKIFDSANGFDQAGLYNAIGRPNYFEIGLDQSSYSRNNYLLSAFTIQPLDIRIEAVMYAQNRSFFIIPGNWFNMNAADTGKDGYRPRGVNQKWPLFGQPLDTKITIDGAITENLPASVGDVSEWYSKWSNIPDKYGTSSVATAHKGDGLTLLYDSMVGWPVYENGGVMTPVRKDDYGRPLPITPRLPVCRSLYYYGEPT